MGDRMLEGSSPALVLDLDHKLLNLNVIRATVRHLFCCDHLFKFEIVEHFERE